MSTPQSCPHPSNNVHNPERLRMLARTGLMDTGNDVNFDRLTKMAVRLTQAPISLVSLVDSQRQYFKSAVGLSGDIDRSRQTPLSRSFCRVVVDTGAPLVVHDARVDARVKDNPVVREMGVIAYLGVPLRLANGAVLGAFCVVDGKPRQWTERQVLDISDLAAAAATEADLRLTIRQQKDVMTVVSHDLKGPLSAIQLIAHNLGHRLGRLQLPAGIGRMIERILTASQRMEEMVLQVLDHARYNAGRVVLDMRPHDAASLVAQALEAMEPAAQQRNIELRVAATPATTWVQCDQGRSVQVLTNLLSNAIKHSPEGTEVRCAIHGDQDRVRIVVSDQGAGIPTQQQAHLFDPFWQAPEGKVAGGHGAGLYGASELAHAQGGELEVKSTPPHGAAFTFELRRPASGPEEAAAEKSAPSP